jgi:acyl carrier protein
MITRYAKLNPSNLLAIHGKRTLMSTDKMEDKIKQFILTEFLPREKPENLHNDTPLRTSGVLDSVATLRLVTFVEEEFGIRVEAHEASVENFDSIDSITAFVQSKITEAS